MKILLVHGYKASPEHNFFPWLRDRLRDLGHEVILPVLPEPAAPNPEEWTKTLLEALPIVDDETIVVGHSLGAISALRFLEAAEARSRPKGALLIAPPWRIKSETFNGFFLDELDFEVLMWKASRFTVLHADDDKLIPRDHAEKYAKVLSAKLVTPETGGHFQGEKYDLILSEINALIEEEIVYAPGKSLDDEFEGVKEI